MFDANDIIELIDFTNSNDIEFLIELDGLALNFFKEEDGMYHHFLIPIETFNNRPMRKNIEHITYELTRN